MANKDYQIERHYELWKDHSKQMGRWVVAALLIAILIPWKVLSPYLESSAQLKAKMAGLDNAKQNLSTIKSDENLVGVLESQLEDVKGKVASNFWGAPIQKLKEDFKELNRAFSRLKRQNPSEIVSAMEFSGREQMTAQMAQSNAPPSDPQPQANVQLLKDLAMLKIDKSELIVQPSSTSGSPILPETISKTNWKALLNTKIEEVPQQMADAAIRQTVTGVYKNAINPVQEIVNKKVAYEQIDELRNQIEDLKALLEKWKQENLGNNNWYQTIGSKNSTIFIVTQTLREWQEDFQKNVEEKKKVLKADKAALETKVKSAEQQIKQLGEKQASLEKELDSILPEWLRGLIKVEEMFQLYPFALLAIIGFLTLKANLLRHHFLVIRDRLIPKNLVVEDPSASSVWTLIYRGHIGTLVTALTYLIITLFLWKLFETGTALTGEWAGKVENEAWPIIKSGLGIILWLGRALFLTALIGISASLFSDWRNSNQVNPKPTS